MFDELVLSSAQPNKAYKAWAVALSTVGQSALVGLLLFAPLIYVETLPKVAPQMLRLVPPPVVQAPPEMPTASHTVPVPVVTISAPAVTRHWSIPTAEPVAPGLPGNLGYDSGGNAIATIIPGTNSRVLIAQPVEQRPGRIRQGGDVQAALITHRVIPQYPKIAQQAHVSGTVVLHAIIATDGTVQQLTFISGPSLLVPAARDAVRQWRYRPTLLNGQPVEVETTVQVTFTLGE